MKKGKEHLEEEELPIIPPTWWALIKRLNWLNFSIFVIPHFITIWGLRTLEFQWKTFWLFVCYLHVTSVAFVAGYHRLWSHRAFVPTRSLEYAIAFWASGAFQRTIIWWARDHRAHHRHIDTDLDPCMPTYNFFWRHLGWFIVKPAKVVHVDLSDLTSNPVVQWQIKWIWPMGIFTSFIFPTLVAGLGWGDWWGGFILAGSLRVNFIHHGTLFANSLAHAVGEQHFDDRNTSQDYFLTNILTYGEGYHNYHHQFPMDYRVGTRWYHFDPSKWFVYTCYLLGWITHINRAPENEVKKATLTMQLKKLRDIQHEIRWPSEKDNLPVVDWKTFQEESKSRPLIVIAGFILDVSTFMDDHPGGRNMLAENIGKDMTTSFFGGVYNHSNAAHNIMSMLRVGVLHGGVEHALEQVVPPAQQLRIVHASEVPPATSHL